MDSAATTTCSESNQTTYTASIDDEIHSPGKPSSQGTLTAKIMEVSTTEEGTDVATTTEEANIDTTNQANSVEGLEDTDSRLTASNPSSHSEPVESALNP